jgi:hypothetical protein
LQHGKLIKIVNGSYPREGFMNIPLSMFGTLSEEAKGYAKNHFKNEMLQHQVTHQKKLNEFRNKVGRVWGFNIAFADYCIDHAQEIVNAIVQAYRAACERFDEDLTEYVITKMKDDFKNAFREEFEVMKTLSPAAEIALNDNRDHILDRFHDMVTAAQEGLRFQLQENEHQRKIKLGEENRPTQNIIVVRDNFGNIQQHGQGNIQIMNSSEKHDENKS